VQYEEIRYIPEAEDPSLTIETEELVAKVIDNTGLLVPAVESVPYIGRTHHLTQFSHHLGYHGIRTLYSKRERRNLVVPFVSWLNLQGVGLEGIETDVIDERSRSGVGRGWPVRMEERGEGALLTIDPLPSMQMKYTLELQPAEPDGIGFAVRFEFGRRPETGPARCRASWPCYMNAFDDVRLFCPQGDSAGEWEWASVGEAPDWILGETVDFQWGQSAFYAERLAKPLAYGRIGTHAWIIMFSDPKVSVWVGNAGGHLSASTVQNPAWDFGWEMEDYPLHQSVGFDGRIVYTPFESPEQIVERYLEWSK